MKRNQTIVECDRCHRTEVVDHTLPADLATLPEGWRQFAHPDPNTGSLLTFEDQYCASTWFREAITAAWEPAPLAVSDRPAPHDPIEAAAAEMEAVGSADDIPF